jgi:hypothetical protein
MSDTPDHDQDDDDPIETFRAECLNQWPNEPGADVARLDAA